MTARTEGSKTTIVDLQLNKDNDDNAEDHPRRLLRMPGTGELLSWGGDTGAIRVVHNENSESSVEIRHWDEDDDIRAVAVSHDGTLIALGFDSGSTVIYTYTADEITTEGKHPFLAPKHPSPKHCQAGPTFSAAIRDLQFYPNSSELLAVATEEGLCVLDLKKNKQERYLQEDAGNYHDGSGIRGISFSANGSTLASLAMDGRLCTWDTASATQPSLWRLKQREQGRCVTRKDAGELLGADAWDRACRPHFISDTVLAVPGETYLQLRKVEEKTVVPFDQALEAGHVESIVAMASSKRNYLVSTGRDKRVILWSITQEDDGALKADFVRQIAELDSAPTDILWEDDERILIACANGKLVTVSECIVPKEQAAVAVKKTTKPTVTEEADIEATNKSPPKSKKTDLTDFDESSYEEVNTAKGAAAPKKTTAQSMLKSTAGHLKKTAMTDFDDSDDDDDFGKKKTESPEPSQPTKNRFVDDEAADDDDDSIDPTQETASPAAAKGSPEVEATTFPDKDDYASEDDDYDLPDRLYNGTATAAPFDLPEPQPAFAPSSSPLDLPRRFMCWNHIGSVTLRHDDSGERRSTVDINFTDSGFRRPVGFTDNLGFIIGSLGEDGGVFATDLAEDDDDGDDDLLGDVVPGLSERTREAVKKSQRKQDPNKPTGSSIYFHRFETFATLRDKDWYLTLPSGERALGCATGEGWAAVMTSRRFLRLFSSGGNQGQILWLDGEPITIVGRSRFLAVFYHEGMPLRDGTQKIGYKLIDAVANRVVASGSTSSISSGATLTWAGFSNDGSLLSMDSAGMVSMLVCLDSPLNHANWEWMPMLDTLGLRKSSDDSYWPVTVYDGKLVCVPLKGGTKYPDATRRPVTAALGLRLPLARGALTKSNPLEELSIRAGIALSQKRVVQELTTDGEDEDFEREYHALSAQVDKVTLKMFAATVEAGKLERALDLVERLHLEKSYDLAMTIADNHRKLVDLIEDAKKRKFPPDDEEYFEDPESQGFTEDTGRPRISPDASAVRKRSFDDAETRHVRQKQTYA